VEYGSWPTAVTFEDDDGNQFNVSTEHTKVVTVIVDTGLVGDAAHFTTVPSTGSFSVIAKELISATISTQLVGTVTYRSIRMIPNSSLGVTTWAVAVEVHFTGVTRYTFVGPELGSGVVDCDVSGFNPSCLILTVNATLIGNIMTLPAGYESPITIPTYNRDVVDLSYQVGLLRADVDAIKAALTPGDRTLPQVFEVLGNAVMIAGILVPEIFIPTMIISAGLNFTSSAASGIGTFGDGAVAVARVLSQLAWISPMSAAYSGATPTEVGTMSQVYMDHIEQATSLFEEMHNGGAVLKGGKVSYMLGRTGIEGSPGLGPIVKKAFDLGLAGEVDRGFWVNKTWAPAHAGILIEYDVGSAFVDLQPRTLGRGSSANLASRTVVQAIPGSNIAEFWGFLKPRLTADPATVPSIADAAFIEWNAKFPGKPVTNSPELANFIYQLHAADYSANYIGRTLWKPTKVPALATFADNHLPSIGRLTNNCQARAQWLADVLVKGEFKNMSPNNLKTLALDLSD
jgi:hypothetical protein